MNRLILMDLQKNIDLNENAVCYWNNPDVSENDNHFSIYQYLEKNSVEVKNAFLDWLEEFRSIAFEDKLFRSSMNLKEDFNYWLLSEFYEISNFSKSKNFNEILKIIALKKYILEAEINELVIYSQNHDLKVALKEIASKDLKIIIKDTFLKDFVFKFLKSLKLLNLRIKPIPWLLLFYIKNIKLFWIDVSHFFKSKASTTFFSYFNNFDSDKLLEDKVFQSSYWGGLQNHLIRNQYNSNWVHISLSNESKKIKALKSTPNKLLFDLNNNPHNNQNHLFIESLFSWSIAFYSLIKFTRIFLISLFREKKLRAKIRFFSLIRLEYIKTFQSNATLENILYFYLFGKLFQRLSNQKRIVFLYENLPWERSLSYFSKLLHESELLATIHTNVRFWDLRYSFFSRDTQDFRNPLFEPDVYCINSKHQRNALIDAGYPIDKIRNVEALRFEYLIKNSEAFKNKKAYLESQSRKKNKNILIIGCYEKDNNHSLLSLSTNLSKRFNSEVDIFYKPHPALSTPYPFKNNRITTIHKIDFALEIADLVITGPLTTVALDAYLFGKRVFVIIGNNKINMSPLRGLDDSVFIYDISKFIKYEENFLFGSIKNIQANLSINDFYFFDSSYPRWNRQLGLK